MSATSKDDSLFKQILLRTFSHGNLQGAATASATEKPQLPQSASSDNLQTKCSNQAFDWGRREPYLRLAHVFDTNSY